MESKNSRHTCPVYYLVGGIWCKSEKKWNKPWRHHVCPSRNRLGRLFAGFGQLNIQGLGRLHRRPTAADPILHAHLGSWDTAPEISEHRGALESFLKTSCFWPYKSPNKTNKRKTGCQDTLDRNFLKAEASLTSHGAISNKENNHADSADCFGNKCFRNLQNVYRSKGTRLVWSLVFLKCLLIVYWYSIETSNPRITHETLPSVLPHFPKLPSALQRLRCALPSGLPAWRCSAST